MAGIGALGDSFYEYILKVWLFLESDVVGKWYFEEAEAIIDHLGRFREEE
jgi:hypothetical protein